MPVHDALDRLQAVWIERPTVAIPERYCKESWHYQFAASANASIGVDADGSIRASSDLLVLEPCGTGRLRIAGNPSAEQLRVFLSGQIVLIATDRAKRVRYATGVQTGAVIDDLWAYTGPLGAEFGRDSIAVRLWAPTAQSVSLLLFDTDTDTVAAATAPMRFSGGVWSSEIDRKWTRKYYLYSVRVYAPSVRQVVTNLVTDPYSADLGLNGCKTRLSDLQSPETKPDGWDAHQPPPLRSTSELSIYELHVRDFSARDESVPLEHRGMYLAFANRDSNGMRHLRELAAAGLKAVHLLPTFHFASVNEDKRTWKLPGDLSHFEPASEQQQAAIAAVKSEDDYNWGYDPVHYLAPAGCYAVEPSRRVHEYRGMVMGLHQAGLRVIQDQVFNHTVSSGQAHNSVLDRIVPSYYYRLDADGKVLNTTCCPDTASERFMMERLMTDAVVQNAREYKIDGFRFDLMGFHFVRNLRRMQEALAKLTAEKDSVDGSRIYLYGEGWRAAETENSAAGPNATQANLFGSGVGTFNDRIRDGIRGGGPFSDPREQGFATGLFTASSAYTSRRQKAAEQRSVLLQQADWVRLGLAGNLRDFVFQDCFGNAVPASAVIYNGQRAGYAASPIEAINYCSVHDNETLFDAVQFKTREDEDIQTRVRRHVLALAIVALGQGIPFFLGGDDLLRSKDMDHNSYDSGVWFNRIDFTYRSANWGIGLPIASENERNWPIVRPLLENSALTPGVDQIRSARTAFREFLRIRSTSRLFRMESAAHIQRNLKFLNTGPKQIPGLIVMTLQADVDQYEPFRRIAVFLNARRELTHFQRDALAGAEWTLHPVQQNSEDPVVRTATLDGAGGTASIPALTAAVFVSG